MHTHRLLLIGFLLSWISNLYAYEVLADSKDARTLADQVMTKASTNDLDGAVALMKPYTIVPAAEIDASLGQYKIQQTAVTQRFGASLGKEFVREEKVGESIIRLTYLHRFEKHPMRWVFIFYRGDKGWVLNTFRFDDNIHALFP